MLEMASIAFGEAPREFSLDANLITCCKPNSFFPPIKVYLVCKAKYYLTPYVSKSDSFETQPFPQSDNCELIHKIT